MAAAQVDEHPGELEQVLVLARPVHPGDLIVLAVAVVVALLGAPDLVAVGDHRHPLAEHQRGEEVPLLPRAQLQHRRVVGGALIAAVPRPVVGFAVAVALTVVVVVLVVVAHEVTQREAVVGDDEVDRRVRTAAVVGVEVRRAGEAGGELAHGGVLAAPVVPDGVAVLAVPLGPQGWEVAHLVAAFAEVPRLGDEFDLADDGVLLHEVEERRELVDRVELPGQAGREVEAEPVDVHLGDPVAQRVQDQLQRMRVAHVHGVAGAGGVEVERRITFDEAVVGGVLDAAE